MLTVFNRVPSSNEKNEPTLFSEAHVLEAKRAKAWFDDRIRRAQKAGIFTEEILLSPVLAELLLQHNFENRTVREQKLSEYVKDIAEGSWALNGESIKIATDGALNDGQHRCQAVVITGNSISTLITFGLERETRMTLDQGAARRAGDYLGMGGIANGNHVAAVASLLWQFQSRGAVSYQPHSKPTRMQVCEVAEQHPEIQESVRAIPSKGSNVVGGRSMLAFCHMMFARHDRSAADTFIKALVSGQGLSGRDPIYQLRERFIRDRRLRIEEKVELTFRAWNAHRQRRSMSNIPLKGILPKIER